MATVKDVGRVAGVSITTVSHVLNGTRFVALETAARVHAAVRELDYSPNRLARGLRTRASGTIGVIGPSALDPFFAEIVVGIEETCYERGYEVYLGFVEYPRCMVCRNPSVDHVALERALVSEIVAGHYDAPAPRDPEFAVVSSKEANLIDKLVAREIDGLIINPCRADEFVAEDLLGIKASIVVFHRTIDGVDGDVMASDDYLGMRAALDRLIAHGHGRIGMVYGFSWESHAARQRFRAYREALLGAGIEPDVDLLATADYTFDGGEAATRRLLALSQRPTAIVYWSDLMALAGMDAARKAGLSVPRDLSVVGFDDLALCDRVCPRLSSIRQEKYDCGVAMARRVIDRVEKKLSTPAERVALPTVYVERESVGRPPEDSRSL